MKKDGRKYMTTMPFRFEKILPGERAAVEGSDDRSLRPSRVLINRTDYDRGADFDGFEVDGKAYTMPPMVGNPTYIYGEVIPPGAKICLSIKNNGELPVYPISVVFFEIVEPDEEAAR